MATSKIAAKYGHSREKEIHQEIAEFCMNNDYPTLNVVIAYIKDTYDVELTSGTVSMLLNTLGIKKNKIIDNILNISEKEKEKIEIQNHFLEDNIKIKKNIQNVNNELRTLACDVLKSKLESAKLNIDEVALKDLVALIDTLNNSDFALMKLYPENDVTTNDVTNEIMEKLHGITSPDTDIIHADFKHEAAAQTKLAL